MKHRRVTEEVQSDSSSDFALPFEDHIAAIEQDLGLDSVDEANGPQKSRFEAIRSKVGRTLGIAGVATAMLIPVYELAASDAVMAKIYNGLDSEVSSLELESPAAEKALEDLGTLAVIELEVLATGSLIARNKRLREVFQDAEGYVEEKQADMTGIRKAVSTALNTPYMLIGKVGDAVAKGGEKLDETDNKTVAFVGKQVIDVGAVNAVGTNGVVMAETMDGNPPSTARIAKLGAYIGATWVGPAEGIRALNRHYPDTVGKVMHGIGWAYTELTHVNVMNPMEAPVGNIAMGSAAVAMIVTGVRMAKYHETQKVIRANEDDIDEAAEIAEPESSDLDRAISALNGNPERA